MHFLFRPHCSIRCLASAYGIGRLGTGKTSQNADAHYFVIGPQAMRSPELPAGSVFMSSALA
jgi:hypothetical protein